MKLFTDPMWDRYFQPQGSGATFYSPGGPDGEVPTSQTEIADIQQRGSVAKLRSVAQGAGEWSARLLPWIARFDAFVEAPKGASKDAYDAKRAEVMELQSAWGKEADVYQFWLDDALLTLQAGAANLELLAARGEEANRKAAEHKAAAEAALALPDPEAAELHLSAARQYLDYAKAYTDAAREYAPYWHAADDAVRASQRTLEQTKQAANRAVDRNNASAEKDWGGLMLLAAVIVAVGAVGAGLASRR